MLWKVIIVKIGSFENLEVSVSFVGKFLLVLGFGQNDSSLQFSV